MLTRKEEIELIERHRNGDQLAGVRLWKAHRGAIRKQAQRFQGYASDEELYQEANKGFWEALLAKDKDGEWRFDLAKGNRFWTYAQTWVWGPLVKLSANNMGFSDEGRKAYKTVLATWENLAQKLGRLPTDDEVRTRAVSALIKRDWEEKAALRGVSNVLEGLARKELSIANDSSEESEPDSLTAIQVADTKTPPADHRLICLEVFRERLEQWKKVLSKDNHAAKLLILYLLQKWERVKRTWPEIIQVLKQPPTTMGIEWSIVCHQYLPPKLLSCQWQEISALFQNPPPKLTRNATKRWYSRACEKVGLPL